MKYHLLPTVLICQYTLANPCQSQNLLPIYSQAVGLSARVMAKSFHQPVTINQTDFSESAKNHLHTEFGDALMKTVCRVDAVAYGVKEKGQVVSGEWGVYEITFSSPEKAQYAESLLRKRNNFTTRKILTYYTWERRNQTILLTFFEHTYQKSIRKKH